MSDYKEVDYEKIEKLARLKGIKSQAELAKAVGRGKSTISRWKSVGRVQNVIVPLLCNVLECEEADIMPTKEQSEAVDTYLISEIGTLKGDMEVIKANLANMHEDIKALMEAVSPDMLTNKDKALILLKQMMGSSARVDEHDYVAKCNELEIDQHSRKYAIEKADCKVQTIGYGSNSKRVIFANVKGVWA